MTMDEYHAAIRALNKVRTSHRDCPARVLKRGRCERGCPFRLSGECDMSNPLNTLLGFDYKCLDKDRDGKSVYISVLHGKEPLPCPRIDEYAAFHGLSVTTRQGPFKGKGPSDKGVDAWFTEFRVKHD